VDDRLQVQLLCRDERKAVGEIEAHLMAEYRARTRAGAVALLHSLFQDAFHQVEVLAHDEALGSESWRQSSAGRHCFEAAADEL
jgi:hypothetical protein